jgi:Fe-S-cluster formation regulator IscX/YfhJ
MERLQELLNFLDFEIDNSRPNIRYTELKNLVAAIKEYIDTQTQPAETIVEVEEVEMVEETKEEVKEETKPKRGRKK